MAPKIMVVDDQPLVCKVLFDILSRGPYQVFSAESAAEALALMEDETMDVVISDERMPGMSGTEFLAIVRDRFPETIRIILTGYASVETAIRAINDSEIYRFLTKPCNSKDLLETVEDALQQKAQGRQAEPQISLMESLEKQAPGITRVRRDADGAILIDEDS